MDIFITGATGFIGKKLISLISHCKKIDKIYCLCRKETDLPNRCIPVISTLEDLPALKEIKADICIHLAGITNFKSPDNIFKVNALGTKAVVDFSKRCEIKKIIFLSSINVYLSHKYEYAQSKIKAEKIIKDSGLEYNILRCSLVYGKDCIAFNKIIKFIKLFGIVPVLGNGKADEQPIYVDEICKLLIKLTQDNESSVIDVYGKTIMSYNEMVKKIANALNKKCLLVHLPIKPFLIISQLCKKLNIPFFLEPEQIFHMCENLSQINELLPYADLLQDFDTNLKNFIK